MTKDEFIGRLKELNLDKQSFATICSIPYGTINNWGVMRDGRPLPVPNWVEAFLNYYEKSKKLDFVMVEICEKIKEVRS